MGFDSGGAQRWSRDFRVEDDGPVVAAVHEGVAYLAVTGARHGPLCSS